MVWVRRQSPPDYAPTRLLIGAGAAGLVVVAFLAAAVPADRTGWRLAVLAVGVGVFALVTGDAVAALATACLAWPTLLGFLVDRYGELHWHGPVDLVRAGVLFGAALGGTALGWAHGALHSRHRRQQRRQRPIRHPRESRESRQRPRTVRRRVRSHKARRPKNAKSLQRSARVPAREEWTPIDG